VSAEWIIDLVPLLLFLAFGASGVYMLVVQFRLFRYLEESHHDRWRYLTSGRWWPGWPNFGSLSYIFSEQDNDDPKIVVLKAAAKRSLLYPISIWGAGLVMALIVGVFVIFFQK
jgi:hypothetical protein